MQRFPKPCKGRGCPEITRHPTGYCNKCRGKVTATMPPYSTRKGTRPQETPNQNREPAKQGTRPRKSESFYHRAAWTRASKSYRAKHPVCEMCGRTGSALVDHIHPIQQGGAQLDEDNMQALCMRCHARKHSNAPGGATGVFISAPW